MTNTARCPRCDGLVGASEEIAAANQVRCPLCCAAFPPSEARPSDEQPPDLFPELMPIPDEEQPIPEDDSPQPSPDASPSESVGDQYTLAAPTDLPQQFETGIADDADVRPAGMDMVVRCPHCHADSKLSELIIAATEEPLDAASLAQALAVDSVEAGAGFDVTTEPWGTIQPLSSIEFQQAVAQSTGTPSSDWTRRRKSNMSHLGQLIGVVLGGLLALPIAYYALNLIRGEQFDWFSVPLPFAPHTYKHLPQWWPQWARPRSGDDSKQDPQQGETVTDDPNRQQTSQDPGYSSVRDYLLFSMSLPERALRSASGLVSGALRESASLLVPHAFQNSKTYSVMVRQMLDFLAEDVGRVKRLQPEATPAPVENFVARKAVGNFVDMAGWATFHLSPMLLLAVVSDVAYGSQAYLRELAGDLKQQGVIDPDSTIDHVDDLLTAVARAAGTTATAFDTPPLSVDGLKQTIDDTRQAVAAIDPAQVIPQAELTRLWREIHQIAANQGVDPLAVSSAMTLYSLNRIGALGKGALSTVRAAGTLFQRHVIDHYGEALGAIRSKGFYQTLAETSKPYTEAVWDNFSAGQTTITEDVLSGRLLGQTYTAVRRWLGG